jgi:cell division protease FtsH
MYTKEYLLSQIKVALGGHAAEELMYGKDSVTTGASSDFAQVHAIAREMVTTYGMSEAVGKINVDVSALSQQTAYLVDLEVHRITDECYSEVLDMLSSRKTDLVALKDILIRDEIIDGKIVYDMIKM